MSNYLQVKNRAASSLAADITSTATSLTVQTGDGAKFPQPGNGFNITIEDEIFKCTARSTDTLTVVRAQEGTTAAAHTAGKAVELRITAGVIESRTTWTADKLLKGAGVGVDPTEINVPAGPTIVRKIVDEIVNNSITLQNDDHLLLAIGANEVWLIDFYLLCNATSSTTPDIKFGWAYPTGCSIRWGPAGAGDSTAEETWGFTNTAGYSNSFSETGVNYHGLAYSPSYQGAIHLIALVINGGTAGNVNLQWAQYTATVEDIKVQTNSCLIAHKIS